MSHKDLWEASALMNSCGGNSLAWVPVEEPEDADDWENTRGQQGQSPKVVILSTFRPCVISQQLDCFCEDPV